MAHEGHDHDDHDHDHGHPHGHRHGHEENHGHARPHGKHGESHAAKEHKSHAPTQVSAYVVTCSDSRGPAQDESGKSVRLVLEGAGHTVVGTAVVPDEPEQIRKALTAAAELGARAVIFNGGTGIGRRDCTIEALQPLFEKTLPGFGEIFRMLSYREIGSPAMLSRAVAGTFQGMIVFALPGSPQAVRLAMEALILPELGHLVRELTR